MCGIAGLIDRGQSAEERRERVSRMCESMRHRGPDDGGIADLGPVTLGSRRLAIFDPAHGRQPMQTPDGRFTIVFNGAILNFRDLKARLHLFGFTFRTDCDTEVLLAAYVHWGGDCVKELRGMFAFAVWDARDESLFLARDPFGIKPLYFYRDRETLLFASELNALVAARVIQAEFDPQAVTDYLAYIAVPTPRTIYRHVRSLRPGETASWKSGLMQFRRSWTFSGIAAQPAAKSRAEFTAQLRFQLEQSIAVHRVADVPVGAFLSGGLDSSAIVGLMARQGAGRLKTFSLAFEEPELSEATEAAATAQYYGTDHETFILRGADVARDFDTLIASMDQPSGDGVNTFYVARAARVGSVTVALSGLGGDELFGGYPSFRDVPRLAPWLRVWHLLSASVREPILARLSRGETRHQKLADILRYARDVHALSSLQRRLFSQSAAERLLRPPLPPETHPELHRLSADLGADDAFRVVSAWELRNYMGNLLLRDSDVMSMRHSLELRVPFVDRPLIEWLWQQPTRFKFTPGRPKSALADALADVLPPGMAARRKRGFTLPFAQWLRRDLRPLMDDIFSPASVARTGLLSPEAAADVWQRYRARTDDRAWSRVWSLGVLIAFLNRRPA
ncbi:asparagine synthase (glutamine-hydrolyzing) [Horticoccus luteus]|uniref:asparagine synthase (glutamine-hydrolyzing) n=1 Tax=Horticoccus luteus TaxID=2862869 RepID=A0A8F9TWG7_9BACT|nr:asparagine synthase (glutamine-hydrolyzing) [Horticoccus luteus]QYM80504.1 asparagine synthase (glutamine-hydrolyzing) [Horticoccus luteus]